jgi:phage shock protein PspC (stress-responsive transcriptional regulator)
MTSLADEIDRLAAQRDAGHLSQAEFEAAKARLFGGSPGSPSSFAEAHANVGRLRRSLADRWVGGVCGGVGHWLGVESWIVRLAFAVAVVFAGIGLIPYVLLWIFVPPEGH